MSQVILEYDGLRGGFCIHFGSFDRATKVRIFDGRIKVFLYRGVLVTGFESYEGRGGLHLGGLLHLHSPPRGEFVLSEEGGSVGPVLIKQSKENIDFWFGCQPLDQPPTHDDTKYSVSMWMSNNQVVGVRLGVPVVAARCPFTSILLSPEDFK